MKKEDLKKLNKTQLENILFETYNRMDSTATTNEKQAKKIGLINDPGYAVYAASLRTECNRINVIMAMELIKIPNNE